MTPVLVFFISHWYLSVFSQSFFDHRYAAHGAFTMSKPWEKFFYIFSYITQGSSYMSPRAYAIMHRMHHSHTDTEKDPHSPLFSTGITDMMLRTNKIYLGIFRKTLSVDEKFTKNVPDWPAFDKWALTYTSSICWSAAYIGYYIYFAPPLWLYLLLPIHIMMGPVHGTIVNWFAHKYGYRNFKMSNASRDLLPFDFLMLGEGYHNNHHKFASRPNFGFKWYEFDLVYQVARILNFFGVIQFRKKHDKTAADQFSDDISSESEAT
jgi:stearoyl-CoA desaturase (Delta-9 desaturase)